MIKVYVMATCPDCIQVKAQLKNNPNYQLVDVGEHVRNLKEFMRLRDSNPAFDAVRAKGSIGIPCFLMEDGTVSFSAEDFLNEDIKDGPACSLDGKGC
ncbi:MAG: glutaredoxin domain-containing protein [Candidatus Limimorpha sp.]